MEARYQVIAIALLIEQQQQKPQWNTYCDIAAII